MSQKVFTLNTQFSKNTVVSLLLMVAASVHAAPQTPNATDQAVAPMASQTATNNTSADNSALNINDTLAAQLQPSTKALYEANQELLSRNAQLQRQVNDLQTQANVLVYESKGQLFLYGAFTVLISLLVGIFISWLVFVRRDRW